MSNNFDSTGNAQITTNNYGVAWLVEMDFLVSGTTVTKYYTTHPMQLTIGGNIYIGFGTFASIGGLSESQVTNTSKLSLNFSAVNQAMLAAAIGGVDTYRGKEARLLLQLLDSKGLPTGVPVRRWTGVMDKVVVTRQKSGATGGSSSGKVEMQCSRSGMARARNAQGLRITDQQHRRAYPTDLGLSFVQNLIDHPTRWLSRRFQEI